MNGFFTPSHTTILDLFDRPDGQFDTPLEITFHAPDGKTWTAPARTITDGASIPSLFANIFGGKLNKEFLFAAIVHDAYCARANVNGPVYQIESWQDTHRMFHQACLANGTPRIKANSMYAGVRLGGPRWALQGEAVNDLRELGDDVLQAEMAYCQSWIEAEGESLSLDAIDQWMQEREDALLQEA